MPILSTILGSLYLGHFLASPAAAATLEESFRAAQGRSEVLGQSREQIVQADERLAQIRGGIFPTLAFNAQHTIQPEPADVVARSFSPPHQTTLSFGLTQPLFRGLREFAGLKQQKHLRSALEAAERQALARLWLDVAANYLNVLSLEQDLKNLREQAGLYEERVGELRARARRGESSESEVLSARSTEAALQAETRLVEGQLEAARETFHFLTGLPPGTPLGDPALLAKGSTALEPLEAYLARIEERPDVKASVERYEASEKNVSVAWGAHLPTLDLVANYYVTRPGFLKDLNWDVGLKLTVPLFEGGGTQAKVREAVSRRAEAQLELERLRRAASQEIRSLRQRLVARLDHVAKLEQSVELADKNSRLLRRDYTRGLARNIDVQLALSDLRATRRTFDQSRFTAQLELLQLRTAAGGAPK